MQDLVETPLEGRVMCLCIRSLIALVLVMVYIIPNPLDYFHISPMSSQLSASPKYFIDTPTENPMILDSNIDLGCEDNMFSMLGGIAINFGSLGCFSGFNASLDPYCMCLGDLPTKITWTTVFNPLYDFSIAIDKVKRIPILCGVVFIIAFYLLFSKLWSQDFDKLLHSLTMSDLKG